jgi:PIN domain nuclease of toxin-antitoxin system
MAVAALLLDTHFLLWAALDPARLSAKARRLLESRDQPLFFSHASLWEVAIKVSLGRPDFAVEPGEFRENLLNAGLQELQIDARHIQRVALLPWIHRDPFDRLLVAQAIEEGLTLLTADRTLKAYGRFVRVA